MMAEQVRRITRILFSPKYLLYTNTAVAGLLLGTGDAIVQNVEIKLTNRAHLVAMETVSCDGGNDVDHLGGKVVTPCFDWSRTGRMFVMGTIMGPFNHAFYTVLDKYLVGNALSTVAKKIVIDETVGAPFFAFSFFMGTGTLEGNSIKESFKEFREKFFTVWLADCSVWPAAQAINFYFLPPRFRVLYVSFVTLGWNTFLSYMKHSS